MQGRGLRVTAHGLALFLYWLTQHAPNGQLVFWNRGGIDQINTELLIIPDIFLKVRFQINGHLLVVRFGQTG